MRSLELVCETNNYNMVQHVIMRQRGSTCVLGVGLMRIADTFNGGDER